MVTSHVIAWCLLAACLIYGNVAKVSQDQRNQLDLDRETNSSKLIDEFDLADESSKRNAVYCPVPAPTILGSPFRSEDVGVPEEPAPAPAAPDERADLPTDQPVDPGTEVPPSDVTIMLRKSSKGKGTMATTSKGKNSKERPGTSASKQSYMPIPAGFRPPVQYIPSQTSFMQPPTMGMQPAYNQPNPTANMYPRPPNIQGQRPPVVYAGAPSPVYSKPPMMYPQQPFTGNAQRPPQPHQPMTYPKPPVRPPAPSPAIRPPSSYSCPSPPYPFPYPPQPQQRPPTPPVRPPSPSYPYPIPRPPSSPPPKPPRPSYPPPYIPPYFPPSTCPPGCMPIRPPTPPPCPYNCVPVQYPRTGTRTLKDKIVAEQNTEAPPPVDPSYAIDTQLMQTYPEFVDFGQGNRAVVDETGTVYEEVPVPIEVPIEVPVPYYDTVRFDEAPVPPDMAVQPENVPVEERMMYYENPQPQYVALADNTLPGAFDETFVPDQPFQ